MNQEIEQAKFCIDEKYGGFRGNHLCVYGMRDVIDRFTMYSYWGEKELLENLKQEIKELFNVSLEYTSQYYGGHDMGTYYSVELRSLI